MDVGVRRAGALSAHIEAYMRILSFFDILPSFALDLILLPLTLPMFLL